MDLSNMDTMQLCEDLATAFIRIVNDNKQILPLFDELIGKGSKFQKDLRATLVSLSSFLDVFQYIADGASATSSSNRNSGTVMTRIVLRQRAFENHLKVISNCLEESVLIPLQNKPDEWRKHVSLLERQHSKDLKMMKAGIKQSTDQLTKLRKKSRKEQTQLLYKQQEKIHEELHTKYMTLEAQERNAVRRINEEERLHFNCLMKSFKPVIQEQTRMISSLEKLKDVHEEIEGCVNDNSAKDAVEETILRNMKPGMEVFTPTIASNKTARRSLERSLSMSSRTSSIESLTEIDGFSRSSFRNNGELEKNLEALDCNGSKTPLCEEDTINEDDPTQMYSGNSTLAKPLKRNPWLHRSNSFINQCTSPPQRFEVPLTNIEEHHEFMPEPMAPLENSSSPKYAGINQHVDRTHIAPVQRNDVPQSAPDHRNDVPQSAPVQRNDVNQSAPVQRNDVNQSAAVQRNDVHQSTPVERIDVTQSDSIQSNDVTQSAPVERFDVTQSAPVQRNDVTHRNIDNSPASQRSATNNMSKPPRRSSNGRRDISPVSQPFPSRCEDSKATEQINKDKDDDSSDGSQDSSSGYGSPGDDCRTNNGTTPRKQFERNNSRRASFSTFSPILPNFARKTNFPKRSHSFKDSERQNQTGGAHRRQSFYAAPPSIPENTNVIPTFNRRDLQAPPNHPQKYPMQLPSQHHHQNVHSQYQHQNVHSQQKLGSFTFEGQHKNEQSNYYEISPSENNQLWSSSTGENTDLWVNSPSQIDPVTKKIEVFPFNSGSGVERCSNKNMFWPANNSLEEEEETLPPPPDNEFEPQTEDVKHRGGDNNTWDENEHEMKMIYDHFYTSDFNKV